MRIVVNGQQAFGKAVLDALIARGENVVAVYCAPDKPGERIDPLKEAALGHGLAVLQPPSFKDPSVLDEFKAFEPDLAVMAYVVLLVPETVLNAPRLGTIQYHPSLLPRHRGPSSINWAIIQGETETGLTIFWPDRGLDRGPILLQKKVPIGPDDTLGGIYFERLFPLGVGAMIEAVDLVRARHAPRIEQNQREATYEGWCRKADVAIDWSRPASEVYNLIRGANPQPGAWTRWAGATLEIFDAALLGGAAGDAAPGTVVAIGSDGVEIAADGGRILAKRLRPEGAGKLAAAEFAPRAGLAPGAVLG